MQKVDSPVALPGCCFLCSSSNRKEYIDTQMNSELEQLYSQHFGAVYICDQCVIEMANLFGFVTTKEIKILKEQKAKFEKQKLELETEVKELRNSLESLITANSVAGLDNDSNSSKSRKSKVSA